jgi:hypothetical protein
MHGLLETLSARRLTTNEILRTVQFIQTTQMTYEILHTYSWFIDSFPNHSKTTQQLYVHVVHIFASFHLPTSRLSMLQTETQFQLQTIKKSQKHLANCGSQMVCQAVRIDRLRLETMLWIRTAARQRMPRELQKRAFHAGFFLCFVSFC